MSRTSILSTFSTTGKRITSRKHLISSTGLNKLKLHHHNRPSNNNSRTFHSLAAAVNECKYPSASFSKITPTIERKDRYTTTAKLYSENKSERFFQLQQQSYLFSTATNLHHVSLFESLQSRRFLSTAAVEARGDSTYDTNEKKSEWRKRGKNKKQPQKRHHRQRQRQQRQKPPSSTNNEKNRAIPTTPWILVTDVPMTSNLQDVLSTMDHILQIELERGIIDLDVAEQLMMEEENKAAAAAEKEEQIEIKSEEIKDDDGGDDEYSPMENEENVELKLVYNSEEEEENNEKVAVSETITKENVDDNNSENIDPTTTASRNNMNDNKPPAALPLWNPYTDSTETSSSYSTQLPSHMVLEARLFLSHSGRFSGWFLRFPNRSVVHAILSHAREGLDAATKKKEEEMMNDTNDIQNNESKTTPQPITIGGKILTLEPFLAKAYPPPQNLPSSYASKLTQRQILYRGYQQKFHQALALEYDDSVVRIENCSFDTSVEDVKMFLKEYDLIYEHSSSFFSGGNDEKSASFHQAVELWQDGYVHNYNQPDASKDKEKNSKGGVAATATTVSPPVFIVRFDSSADARAAIREKQYHWLKGRKVRMVPYPNQILS